MSSDNAAPLTVLGVPGSSALPSTVGNVVYQVYVNGIPYSGTLPIISAQLSQAYGEHDMFTVYLGVKRGVPISGMNIWPDNTPIQIVWGRSPNLNTWYGYVNNHEISTEMDDGSSPQQVTYALIGTSSVMNSRNPQLWQNVSPTYIAKSMALKYGFRAVVTPIAWIMPSEQQTADESDFTFMNRIANKTGMRFWVSGGTLYMVSPDVALFNNVQSTVPTFNANKNQQYVDNLQQFNVTKGTNITGNVVANRQLYGIDKDSGQLFSVQSAAPTTTASATPLTAIKTDMAVSNYVQATNLITAWANLSQFWVTATAKLFGITTAIYPGKLVNLQGAAIPQEDTGTWMVHCARHALKYSHTTLPTADRYCVNVTLIRNSQSQLNLSNVQPVTPEFVPMTIVNGTWMSDNLGVITSGTAS